MMPAAQILVRASRQSRLAALALMLSTLPCLARQADAQADTVVKLIPITVSVTREGPRTSLELPFAVSRITVDSARPGLRRASVGEFLMNVPGVQVQDRANPSQDPRLSIRGFGSRSAFGVRGVRVLRDGVPLSLPDGQTPLDWLDLESIGDVEVIRGTAAALFGNAAGGVVSFRSRPPSASPLAVSARAWNSGALTRTSASLSGSSMRTGTFSDPSYLLSLTHTEGEGARQWSRQEATSGFLRAQSTLLGTRVEVNGTVYDTPRAENTGALTAAELGRDPSLPDSLNITKHSLKAVRQSQLALIASLGPVDREISASMYAGNRSLDNPLPFSVVGVERKYYGASVRGTMRHELSTSAALRGLRLTAGADAQWQRDDRLNWENCSDRPSDSSATTQCPTPGAVRGAVRLDQQELVNGSGSYVRGEVELPSRVFVSGALRHDQVGFTVHDHFMTATNADDSGDRTMSAVSPLFGIVWRMRPLLSLYANASTAFETPTITELTNQPDGRAGLNSVISPQRTQTIETGLQGYVFGRVQLDLAAFTAQVQDELVSFDVPNAPGRRAFRNAGKTSRKGFESSLRARLPFGETGAGYTLSRFRFVDYTVGTTSFAGKPIPGIPEQQLQAYVTLRRSSFYTTIEATAASRVSANDAATVFAPGYAVWSARAGYEGTVGARWHIAPVIGVDNIFDRHYATSVVTNATRGRFFEPGSELRVYGGLRVGVP